MWITCLKNRRVKKESLEAGNTTEFSTIELKRKALIHNIQELHQKSESIRSISSTLKKSRATVSKYLTGDPNLLCLSTKQGKRERLHSIEAFRDIILKCVSEGSKTSDILKLLQEKYGYKGSESTFRKYFSEFLHEIGVKKIGPKQRDKSTIAVPKEKVISVSHREIFQYLWMNIEFKEDIAKILFEQHPYLLKTKKYIMEFRYFFNHKCQTRLYLFIESCKISGIKPFVSLGNGLERDLEAVECAVSSEFSNGFVEGVNNKLKMIKRTMYGRCRPKLLEAKMVLPGLLTGVF